LCYGNEITINVLPNGGRIQSREIQWFSNDSVMGTGNQFTFNSQQWYALTNDTQFVFKALVDDGCSFKDSTTFQIAITRPLTVKINTPTDTVFVCNGQELTFDAIVSGGQSDDYILEWWTDEGDTATVNSFTQIFSKGKTLSDSIQTVNVRLSDGCTAPTVFDRISVVIDKAPLISLKNQSNAYNQIDDTLICWGEIITLNSTVFYADVSNQNPRWYIDGQMQNIDWNFTIPTNVFLNMVNQQFVVQVVWEDECGIFNDTATLVVNVRDSLDWNTTNLFPDTLICYETDLEMSSQLMGGLPSGYQWEWKNVLNNEVLGTDSFLALNRLVENIQISLTASDQCSVQEYEYNINIEVRPPLEITLASNTDCANPDAELTATPLGGKMDDYNIEWENTDGQIIGSGINITLQPLGIQTYKATLTDGCSFSAAEAEITIDQTPIINNFDFTPTEGCEPLPVVLAYQTDYPNSHSANIQWGDGNQSNFNNLNSENQGFNHQYATFGEFTASLQITSETGCNSMILNEDITVWPLPFAGFSYSPLEPSLDSNLVNFLNTSSGAISYQWEIENMGTFTEENPIVLFSDTGIYNVKLVAFTDRNCKDSTLQQVYIKPNFKIFPPTVFSPNNDGLNDRFRPIATGYESIQTTIYNRWGAIIYQSNHNEGWDGTYGGVRVPQGAYYYTIRIVSLQKELRFLSGTVTVVY
jgi:gliding motility-associated-like protein